MKLRDLKILYVEDEKQSRKALGIILLDFFKDVYLASNGKEAVEIYKEKKVDIILSDISMPEMDGIDMSIEIKKINKNQPIILLTASQNYNYLEKAIEIGVYRYVLKPIKSIKYLIKILETVAEIITEENDSKKLLLEIKENNDIKYAVRKLEQDDFFPPTVLYKAYLENEFEIYYQPQINIKTNKYIAMDALIRWNKDDKIIYPNDFILGMIKIGMMVMVDDWVLETSIKQFSKLYQSDLRPGVLSLNLRMQSLNRDGFINNLKLILRETNFIANNLEFKIREHDILIADDNSINRIRKISELGIRISIANFGKGFVSYIKKIPINKIKINKSFIDGIPDKDDSMEIIKAIIMLGKRLNIEIVAEGVENLNQLRFLIENNCELIQGFLYLKPLPLDKIQKKLKLK